MAGILERLERKKGGRRTKSAAEILVRPPQGHPALTGVDDRPNTTIVEAPIHFSAVEVVDLGGDRGSRAAAAQSSPSLPPASPTPTPAKEGAPPSLVPRWLTTPTPQRGPIGALTLRAYTLVLDRHGSAPITPGDTTPLRAAVEASARELTREMRIKPDDVETVVAELAEFLWGYGPIAPLFDDEAVTDIWIDSPNAIRCRREGSVVQTPLRFRSVGMCDAFLERLRSSSGEKSAAPARFETLVLADSWRSRLSITRTSPGHGHGLSATFRIPRVRHATLYELAHHKTVPLRVAAWLESTAHAGAAHMVVLGPPGSGRTTFTSALLAAIGSHERVATIEPLAELSPPSAHFERLPTTPTSERTSVDVAALHAVDRLGFGDIGDADGNAFRTALEQGWRGIIGDLRAADAGAARDFLLRVNALPTTFTVFVTLRVRSGRHVVSAVDVLTPVKGESPRLDRIVTLVDGSATRDPDWTIEGSESFSPSATPSGDSRPTTPEARWPRS